MNMHECALKTRRVSKTSCSGSANIACWGVFFFFVFFNMLLNLMGSVNSRRCAQSADRAKSKHFKSGEFQKLNDLKMKEKFCINIKSALHFWMMFCSARDDNKCSTCEK